MSQFLIVQSAAEGGAAGNFARARDAFRAITGLAPSGCFVTQRLAMAAFPKMLAPSPGLVADPRSGRNICEAGLAFYQGRCGSAALEHLVKDLADTFTNDGLVALLADVEGIFALASAAPEDGQLMVITDRLGSLHVYVAEIEDACIITTSALVAAAVTNASWDMDACREFLDTGTVFETRSLFQGVRKLGPAGIYRFWHGRQCSTRRYWRVESTLWDRAPVPGDVPALAGSLVSVMDTLAANFRAPLLDLTGGLDSRALLAASRHAGHKFSTVVNGSEHSPDVVAAGRIARAFDLPHRNPALGGEPCMQYVRRAAALTDGEFDAFEYARILRLHEHLAAGFDVSINGSNGEICKGYWWELLFPFRGRPNHFDERRVAARRFAFAGESAVLDHSFPESLAEHFAGVIRRANANLEGYPNTACMDNVYLTLRMQRWQGRIASSTLRLWPCASPFMWRRPMEAALAAPPAKRKRNRMSLRVIERLDPHLAAMPYAREPSSLPRRVRAAFGTKGARSAAQSSIREDALRVVHPAMITAKLYRKSVLTALDCQPEIRLRRMATLDMAAQAIQQL